MKLLKWVLTIGTVILLPILLGSCGIGTPIPISTAIVTRVPSHTPNPTGTPSPIPTSTPTPDFCNSALWQDKIQVLSGDLFTALEPGGPPAFDRILVEKNPAWADFRQEAHGEIRSAGVTFHETAFGPELGTGVNPAVLLVTYGVERNWELPASGDLISEVDRIRAVLRQHESDIIHGRVELSEYPMVANGATYALYRYFNGDVSKLEEWCRTYVQVYGESPMR